MATPLTAGAVALVREFLRTRQGIANPSAALIKALLIAGAERLAGTAPAGTLLDSHQGFGRVNLDRSLKRVIAAIDAPGLATGQGSTFTINVPSASKTLRVALAYADFPGDALVNNLNVIANDPSGKGFAGIDPVPAARHLRWTRPTTSRSSRSRTRRKASGRST